MPPMEHVGESVPVGEVGLCAIIGARSTTSAKATVMPPPVGGWCMFHASPRRMTPSFECGPPCSTGGRDELGMRRSRSFDSALWMAACRDAGNCGTMLVRMWFYRGTECS